MTVKVVVVALKCAAADGAARVDADPRAAEVVVVSAACRCDSQRFSQADSRRAIESRRDDSVKPVECTSLSACHRHRRRHRGRRCCRNS